MLIPLRDGWRSYSGLYLDLNLVTANLIEFLRANEGLQMPSIEALVVVKRLGSDLKNRPDLFRPFVYQHRCLLLKEGLTD
jgi:hypothetical protein